MNANKSNLNFHVQNKIRSTIFLLLYVLLFLLSIWLLPVPFGWVGISALIVSLVVIAKSDKLFSSVMNQTFDQIALQELGVEFSSGIYGDEWLRPYNEFRVEYQIKRILFVNFYRVRVKHKVLDNLLVASTRSKDKAEKVARAMIENSRLRLLK